MQRGLVLPSQLLLTYSWREHPSHMQPLKRTSPTAERRSRALNPWVVEPGSKRDWGPRSCAEAHVFCTPPGLFRSGAAHPSKNVIPRAAKEAKLRLPLRYFNSPAQLRKGVGERGHFRHFHAFRLSVRRRAKGETAFRALWLLTWLSNICILGSWSVRCSHVFTQAPCVLPRQNRRQPPQRSKIHRPAQRARQGAIPTEPPAERKPLPPLSGSNVEAHGRSARCGGPDGAGGHDS